MKKFSVERYEKLMDNLVEGILITDEKGVVVKANLGVEKIFDTKGKLFINKPLQELIGRQVFDIIWKKAININEEKGTSQEAVITRLSGEKRDVLINSFACIDPNGKPEVIFVIIKDITTRKRLEKDLMKTRKKSEELNRLKNAFLANMSHEIRTPLNAILGFADLLDDDKLINSEQSSLIKIIKTSGYSLLQIINNMVDLSRLEAGELILKISDIDLHNLVTDLYEEFKDEANKKELRLILNKNIKYKNLIIKSDYKRLKHIISNLLSNAIKFTSSGNIIFGYTLSDDEVDIYVKDTGIGIAPEFQEVIFDSFRQIDISLSRHFEGAGLGLSLSRKLVKLLGGRIELKSTVGVGSSFSVCLPYAMGKKHMAHLNGLKSDSGMTLPKNLNILIVEDTYSNYLYMERLFARHNIQVLLWAKDGKEAIMILKDNPEIDLILMDLNMPIMDGFTATKEIRKFDKTVKIIAVTAYTLRTEEEDALKAGCNAYLSKPVLESALLEKVNRVFD